MKTETMSLCILFLALVAGCDRFLYPPIQVDSAQASKMVYSNANLADDLAYINQQIAELSKAGIGAPARDLNYELLQNSATANAKLLYAGRYVEAFDSQLWNMTTDPRILNSSMKDSFQEKCIRELANHIPNLSVNHPPLTALAPGNSMGSFYAIVSSLHRINVYRDIFREKSHAPDTSFLDLIQSALTKEAAVRRGEISYDDLTKTEVEILKRAATFRYSMMIRHRYLPLLALGRLSQINDEMFFKVRNLLKKATPDIADIYTYQFETKELDQVEEKAKHSLPHYDKVKKLNLVQLYYAQEIITEAIKARDFIKSLGYVAKLDPKIYTILSNLHLNYTDLPYHGDHQLTQVQLDLVDGLNQKIKELLAE